jgi:hypothetical protein
VANDALEGGQSGESGEPTVRISAEAHDRASTNQAGQDQHITTNYYYGRPPSTPPTNAEPIGGGGWFTAHRSTWITAGATVVVALIGVLGTQFFPDGDKGAATSHGSPSSSASPSPTTAAPTTSSPAQSQSPAVQASAVGVQWQGALLLSESTGGKDLDSSQPVVPKNSSDNDVYAYHSGGEDTLQTGNGAIASVWDGSSALPTYDDCAGTVDAAGATEQPLDKDTVLCVKTGEGRIARLKVTSQGDGIYAVVKFDGVVWNLAE